MSESESYDESYKDQKYFVNGDRYNCPFCNRRHVSYVVIDGFRFDWSRDREVFGYIVRCDSCDKKSMHLSYFRWSQYRSSSDYAFSQPPSNVKSELKESYDPENLDEYFFYKKPTSFFVIDNRIPKNIRSLISEAEGCRDMGYMTGASGALRKAIYKFLKHEKTTSENYEDKIKELKQKHPKVPEEYIDALSNVQGMTSDNLHEDYDFDPWNSKEFTYFITAFRELMIEIYVKPEEQRKTLKRVLGLDPSNRKPSKEETKASEQ